ncbi:hypothetical protein Bca101_067545 [Brassica carinata]
MGLTIYENMFMKILQPKERKAQQENTRYGRIIYQSGGNSETVDHAKGHDQPKSFATTNSQIRLIVLVFGLWSLVFGQVFLVFISC